MRNLWFLFLFVLAAPGKADTTIFDDTFFLQDWDLIVRGGTNLGSVVEGRSAGTGVTGAERIVTGTTGNGQPFTYEWANVKNNRFFDPKNDGEFDRATWEIWVHVVGPAEYQNLRFLLHQRGQLFIGQDLWEPPIFTNVWQRASGVEPATRHALDFSVTAEPIYAGYLSFCPVFLQGQVRCRNSFFNVVFITQAPTRAQSASLQLGTVVSGDLSSLARFDDGDSLVLSRFLVPNQASPIIAFTMSGASPTMTPSKFEFRTGSRMLSQGPFEQTLRLYDFDTGAFTESRTDPLGTTSLLTALAGTGDLGRFVGVNGEVMGKVEIRQVGPAAVSPPSVAFDAAVWQINRG